MELGTLGDGIPFIESSEDGKVGVWVTRPDGVAEGFVMNPVAAEVAAFRLLAAAHAAMGAGKDRPKPLVGFTARPVIANPVTEDMAARLVFERDGAAFAFGIGAGDLAEFAAAVAALSREVG